MAKKVYGPEGSKITIPVNAKEYKKLKSSDTLQAGDLIFIKNMIYQTFYEVVRVTKTTAIIMYNTTAEGIYRIQVGANDEVVPKPKSSFDNQYRAAYRKINP